MKENVIIGIIIAGILIGSFFIANSFSNKWDKNMQEKNELLGEEVVIRNDTLTVVGYSILGDTYTLSNGTKVSSEFLSKE